MIGGREFTRNKKISMEGRGGRRRTVGGENNSDEKGKNGFGLSFPFLGSSVTSFIGVKKTSDEAASPPPPSLS